MCIFSQPVISVDNTQIFARATARATQYLVYQMNYETRNENAMILPVPVSQPAHKKSLWFIDLKDYTAFFTDLADGFPYSPPLINISCGDKTSRHNLEVFRVGNYIASFVPSLSDFSRLDSRFTLPQSTWSKIPQYKNYGFAVFQLAAGSLRPHPMAFEYQCDSNSLYFPTMHIHDGQIHETEEFDHVLYMQHAGFDSRVGGYQNSEVPDNSTDMIRSKYVAKHFCNVERSGGTVAENLLVHRQFIHGDMPNGDTWVSAFGDPEIPTLNLRPWLSYLPWLVTGGVVAWFFARRNKVRKMKSVVESSDAMHKI